MNTTEITPDTTIGSIVTENFRTVGVFHKYGIDFCCGGGKPLETVCRDKGIDYSEISTELLEALRLERTSEDRLKDLSLTDLADYIELKHHRYVEENTPLLQQFLDKLCRVHGTRHEELFAIRDIFDGLASELAAHMRKEELILFPYIRNMEMARKADLPSPNAAFGSVQNPIAMMEHEHDSAGRDLDRIQELTHGYMPPADACNTFRITYQKLQEFHQDLMVHIHLENNILFKRAEEFEKMQRS